MLMSGAGRRAAIHLGGSALSHFGRADYPALALSDMHLDLITNLAAGALAGSKFRLFRMSLIGTLYLGLFIACGVTIYGGKRLHALRDCLQLIYLDEAYITGKRGAARPRYLLQRVYRSLRGCSRQAKSNMNGSDKASEKNATHRRPTDHTSHQIITFSLDSLYSL